ncbi:MAG: DUF5989 family protein [Planctomycetota bacterium]
MISFLKENWIWILAPIVLMTILVLAGLLLSGDAVAPFEYALF